MNVAGLLIGIVQFASRVLFLLVIGKVILSYFMSPFHPVREFVDRIVDPMLAPIRRFIPTIQGLDISPIIFIVILNILESLLIRLILTTLG